MSNPVEGVVEVELQPVFWGVCVVTVLSPGPAVLMTLGNALTERGSDTVRGIAGLFCGTVVVAVLIGAGVGSVLRNAPQSTATLRWLGAAYLGWLGWRLWRSSARTWAVPQCVGPRRHFIDGVLLQCINPYTVAFFSSVLPQFVDPGAPVSAQLALLNGAYLLVMLTGHSTYAVLAQPARRWLVSEGGARALKRVSALLFWLLAASLLSVQR